MGVFDYRAPDVVNAFDVGFSQKLAKRDSDMKQQMFAQEQADKQELRNAMAEYGAARTDEEKQAAIGKVGVVSPEAQYRLQSSYLAAKQEERAALKDMTNTTGQMAYIANQEKDPAKRQQIWDKWRGSLPEQMQRAIPPEADETTIQVMMAQSADAMDMMNRMDKIKSEKDLMQFRKEMDMEELGMRRELMREGHKNEMEQLGARQSMGGRGGSIPVDLRAAQAGLSAISKQFDKEPYMEDDNPEKFRQLNEYAAQYQNVINRYATPNAMQNAPQVAPQPVQNAPQSQIDWSKYTK